MSSTSTFLKSFLIATLVFFAGNSFSQTYCAAGPGSTADSDLGAVTLNGQTSNINWTNSCPGVTGVSDFTSFSADLDYSGNYSITIEVSTCGGNFNKSGEAWIDWNQDGVYDPSESIVQVGPTTSTASGSASFLVPATALPGITRMRVMCQESGTPPLNPCGTFTWGSVEEFEIEVVGTPPSCLPPSLGATTNLNPTNVTLNWSANSTGSIFQIEYGAPGFALGSGTQIIATGSSYVLSGLTANTAYQYFVRQVCSATNVSAWSGPVAFQTPCVTTPVTLPVTEGFESFSNSYTSSNQFSCEMEFVTSGAGLLEFNRTTFQPFSGNVWAALSSAIFSFGNPVNSDLVFTYNMSNYDANFDTDIEFGFSFIKESNSTFTSEPGDRIFIRGSQSDPWIEAYDWQIASAGGANVWITVDPAQIDVDNLLIQNGQNFTSTFQIRLGNESDATWFSEGVGFDNLVLRTTPSCFEPTEANISSITGNGADIAWTAGNASADADIEYGPAGFTLGTGTQLTNLSSLTSNPFTLSGLLPNTSYDVYVRDNCGGTNGVSSWFGPINFWTARTAPYFNDFEVPTTGLPVAWSDYSIDISGGGLANVSITQFNQKSGASKLDLDITGSGDTVAAFSPAFSDLSSGNKRVIWSTYFSSTFTAQRLYIGIAENPNDPSTWQIIDSVQGPTSGFNVYVDDTITLQTSGATLPQNGHIMFLAGNQSTFVDCFIDDFIYEETPTCFPPAITSAIGGTDSAIISYTQNPSSLGANVVVEYGQSGFTLGNGLSASFSSATNPFVLTGLIPNLAYDIYIKDSCSVTNTSAFSNLATFNTVPANGGSVTVTYGGGDIPTDGLMTTYPDTSSCPGFLDVVIPVGVTVTGVDVSYEMSAIGGAWISEQSSYLACVQTGLDEGSIFKGNPASGNAGTESYSRAGLSIANGLTNDSILTFKINGGRDYTPFGNPTGCSVLDNKIDSGTWTITVNYLNSVTCAVPTNGSITGVSDTSLTVSWTRDSMNTGSTVVEYGQSGFTLGTGAVAVANGSSFTANGLIPETGYDFWIYDSCAAGDFSAYVGPISGVTRFGDLCENAFPITSLPFIQTGQTTQGFGDDYTNARGCSNAYIGGDDYVYSWTPTASTIVDIDLTNTGTWVGLFVFDGCPDDVNTSCVASNTNSAGNPTINGVVIEGGQEYYIVISTFPAPQFTAFDISITEIPSTNAALNGFTAPTNPVIGQSAVVVEFENLTPAPVFNANIEWSVRGVSQGIVNHSFGSSGLPFDSVTTIPLGLSVFQGAPVELKAWIVSVDGSVDLSQADDTIQNSFCGPIAGTFTIGGASADFVNFEEATAALNCGLAGPVTFNVNPGTYTENVVIPQALNTSAVNTVTFDGGAASLVTITTAASQSPAVLFNGAENVIFKNFTVQHTNTGSDAWGIALSNASENIIIEDNIVDMAPSTTFDRSGIVVSGSSGTSIFSATSQGNNANNVTIRNNTVSGADYGISIYGAFNNAIVGFEIVDNTVDADSRGIFLQYVDSSNVEGNETFPMAGSNFVDGIYLSNSDDNIIQRNYASGSDQGMFVTSSDRNVIRNNFILGGGTEALEITTSDDNDIFNNSMTGSPAIFVNSGSGYDIRNNILVSQTDFAFETGPLFTFGTAPTFTAVDYNIYFSQASPALEVGTTTYASLSAWQTADPANNQNSLFGNPGFASSTDLHLTTSTLADGAGIALVLNDFDGTLRNPVGGTSDIGADDYTPIPADLELLSVLSPAPPCYTNSDTLIIEVANRGLSTVDFSANPFNVVYDVTGPNAVAGQALVNSGTVAGGDTAVINLGVAFDLSALGIYNIDVNIAASWDPITSNDSILGIELENGDLLTVSPIFDTITTPFDSIEITSASPTYSGGAFNITEVVQFETGQGPGIYPPYIGTASTDWDGIEITNVASNAASDISGYTVDLYGAMNGSYTFPAGTSVPPLGVVVLFTKTGLVDDPANLFFTANISGNVSSGTQQGYVLRDPQGNVADAVALNGYDLVNNPAAAITAADWSGNIPGSGGRAGVMRDVSDNNLASDWSISSTSNVLSIGVYNPSLNSITVSASAPSWWTLFGAVVDSGSSTIAGPFTQNGLYDYTLNVASQCGALQATSSIFVDLIDQFDGASVLAEPNYTSIPSAHVAALGFQATIENRGYDNISNASARIDLDGNFVDSASVSTIPYLGSETFIFEQGSVTNAYAPGVYGAELITGITETDGTVSNDVYQFDVNVTADYMSRDDDSLTGGLGLNGVSGIFGHIFDVMVDDTLTGAEFFIANTATVGDRARFAVWSVDSAGNPDSLIEQSPIITITDLDTLYEVNYNCPIILTQGRYLLTVEQLDLNNLGFGYSATSYSEDNVGFFSTNSGATWTSFETLGAPLNAINLMLRAKFGDAQGAFAPTGAPVLVSSDTVYCSGETAAMLMANPSSAANVIWYDDTARTNTLAVGNYLPSTTVADTFTYYVAEANGTCAGDILESVQVVVNESPNILNVLSTNTTSCGLGDGTLDVNIIGGTAPYSFTATDIFGTSLTDTSSLISNLSEGSYSVVAVDDLGCTSDTSTGNIIVAPNAPAAPTVSVANNGIFCAGNTTATVNASSTNPTALFTWYSDISLLNQVAVGPTYIPTDTAQNQTFSYYVTQTIAGCEGVAAVANITTFPLPPAPAATGDSIGCQSEALSITAAPGYSSYAWYSDSTLTNSIATTRNLDVPATVGVNTYYVTGIDLFGCPSSSSSRTVEVLASPAKPVLQDTTYCSGEPIAGIVAGSAQSTFVWYSDAGLNNVLDTTSVYQPVISGAGFYIYYAAELAANGCLSVSDTASVQVFTSPQNANLGPNLNYCDGDVVAPLSTGNIPGTTTNWYADRNLTNALATGNTYTPATTNGSQVIYATLSNANCVSPADSVTVTVNPPVAKPTVSADIDACANESFADMTASGSGGQLEWYLNKGANGLLNQYATGDTVTPSGVTGTTKYYVVENLNGCIGVDFDSVTVQLRAIPSVASTVTDAASCLTADGEVLLQRNGGTGTTYDFTLVGGSVNTTTPGADTALFTGLSSGVYNVYVEDSLCTSDTSIVSVGSPDQPLQPLFLGGKVSYCSNDTLEALRFEQGSTTGGTLEYYTNASLTGTPVALTNDSLLVPQATVGLTTYYVVENLNGCISTVRQVQVNITQVPAAPMASADQRVCFGTSLSNLSVNGSGGTYTWYKDSVSASAFASGTSVNPGLFAPISQDFLVVETINGCASAPDTVNVIIDNLPNAPTVAGNLTSCLNQTVGSFTASGGTGNYNWYSNVSLSNQVATGATYTPMNNAAGTFNYYVSQIDANGCEGNGAVATIIVNPVPQVPSAMDTSYCDGETVQDLMAVGNGGTYTWKDVSGNVLATGVNYSTGISSFGSFDYVLTETNAFGCESDGDTVTVDLFENPSIDSLVVQDVTGTCVGNTGIIEVFASAGTGSYTYNVAGAGLDITSTTALFDTLFAGSYTVTVDDGNCVANSSGVAVQAPGQPLPPVLNSSYTEYCDGDVLVDLSASVDPADTSANATVLWFDNQNLANSIATGGTLTPSANIGTQTYYVIVDNNGCPSSADTVSVRVKATPASPSVTGNNSYCEGDAVTALTAQGGNGVFTWYSDSNLTASVSNTNAYTPAGGSVGNEVLYVTESLNGCESDATVETVVVNSNPTVTFASVSNACENDGLVDLRPFATPAGGTFGQVGSLQTVFGFNYNTAVSGSGQEDITYTFTDAATGCSASDTTSITIDTVPNVTLPAFTAVCADEPVFALTSGIPANGTYSGNGVTNNSFDASLASIGTPNAITYEFTDGNGCAGIATNTITVNALPNANAGVDRSVCIGSSTSLTASAGGSLYLWSTGATTRATNVTPNATATYTVTLTNANGCTNSDDVVITVDTLPNSSVPNQNDVCEDSGFEVLTGGLPAGGVYSGSNVSQQGGSYAINTDLTGSGVNTVYYTVTDGNGCQGVDSATILVNQLPSMTFGTIADLCENSGAYTLTEGLPAGGVYTGNGVSGNDYIASAAGQDTITYTYTDPSTGCENFIRREIIVNQLPSVGLGLIQSSACENSSAVTLAGGTPTGGTYFGDDVSNNQIDPITVGNNTIVYVFTDPTTGCSNADSSTFVVNGLPNVDLGDDNQVVDDVITLNAGLWSTYQWSTGETTQSITVNGLPGGNENGDYSVTVTDLNGCSNSDVVTVTFTTSMNDLANYARIQYYPNPTDGLLNVNIEGLEGKDANVTITTLQGQVVEVRQINSMVNTQIEMFDLSNEAQGVYLIRFEVDGKQSVSRITVR